MRIDTLPFLFYLTSPDGQQSNAAADKVAPYKRPPKKYSVGDEPWVSILFLTI